MALGCGGPSRLGRRTQPPEHSVAVVRAALEQGVNFFDTAESYGTEGFIGQAIAGWPRDRLVISTKKTVSRQGEMAAPDQVRVSLEKCLSRLKTDYVDVLHMHNVRPGEYRYVREQLAPEALKLIQEGKVRALGITEDFEGDSGHSMLVEALRDDCWDVMMLGFNIVNQSARARILPQAIQRGVATMNMYALRHLRHGGDHLRDLVARLVGEGRIDAASVDLDNPLGFLLDGGVVGSPVEAAVRFCRLEPGITSVLTGTGDAAHVAVNAGYFELPPLPPDHVARLREIFARVDHIS
jgi:aryl-alcohol dehydrogenase-like predicted oxidoreductase